MTRQDAAAARRARASFWRARRALHPRLWEALLADASVTARYRGERSEFTSAIDAGLQMLRLFEFRVFGTGPGHGVVAVQADVEAVLETEAKR